jgi:hypothetical protein
VAAVHKRQRFRSETLQALGAVNTRHRIPGRILVIDATRRAWLIQRPAELSLNSPPQRPHFFVSRVMLFICITSAALYEAPKGSRAALPPDAHPFKCAAVSEHQHLEGMK